MSALGVSAPCAAQQVLEGDVPLDDGVAYFTVPFEVPAGTAEIEVRHDDLSEANVLDWGVLGPDGFRGYGGGNSEPAIIGVDASSRGYLTGPIAAGTWQVYVGEANVEERPARYRIEVVLRSSPTLPAEPSRTRYAPASALSTEPRWYAGDFHVHSRESGDATPSLEEVATRAEEAGLDFVMLSEHNTISQLELYAETQARHPNLLLVPGIEVTTYEGHFMSLGGTRWIDHRLGVEGRTLDDVAADVHEDGALFSVNHPALDLGSLCIGCGWTGALDPAALDALEVQTGAFSATGRLFYRSVVDRWEELVSLGHHVAAIGGSDDHRAGAGTGPFDSPIGSPTTMVYADELSVAAILAGLRAGRTVVRLEGPGDPMVELSATGLEGDTIEADRTTLLARVTGVELGAELVVVREGRRVDSMPVIGREVSVEIPLVAGSAPSPVRVELEVGGEARVVTSHVFLRPSTPGGPDAGLSDAGASDAGATDAGASLPGSGGGCGCGVSSPAASPWPLPWLAAILGARAFRRRR
jgi:MYXO-CTERM domain-containing protein